MCVCRTDPLRSWRLASNPCCYLSLVGKSSWALHCVSTLYASTGRVYTTSWLMQFTCLGKQGKYTNMTDQHWACSLCTAGAVPQSRNSKQGHQRVSKATRRWGTSQGSRQRKHSPRVRHKSRLVRWSRGTLWQPHISTGKRQLYPGSQRPKALGFLPPMKWKYCWLQECSLESGEVLFCFTLRKQFMF